MGPTFFAFFFFVEGISFSSSLRQGEKRDRRGYKRRDILLIVTKTVNEMRSDESKCDEMRANEMGSDEMW